VDNALKKEMIVLTYAKAKDHRYRFKCSYPDRTPSRTFVHVMTSQVYAGRGRQPHQEKSGRWRLGEADLPISWGGMPGNDR